MTTASRPVHGGDILRFCQMHGFAINQVSDLSTGISPWAWPVPEIPAEVWQHLPHSGNYQGDLLKTASVYYGCDKEQLLPVAGSQAAIEVLPMLAERGSSVAIPSPGYEEHGYCWQRAGMQIQLYKDIAALQQLVKTTAIKYAVVINPNNPSAEITSAETIDALAEELSGRGGFLIVDAAYADSYSCADSDLNQMPNIGKKGLITLRSVGKFFGVAGIRLGFVTAHQDVLSQLQKHLGLWSVSTVALWLGAKMLADRPWIAMQLQRLATESVKLLDYMTAEFPALRWRGTQLFVSGVGERALVEQCQLRLVRAAICIRGYASDFDSGAQLRIGLPDADGWQRLDNIKKSSD